MNLLSPPPGTASLFVRRDLPAVRALTTEAVLFAAGRCV